MKNLELEWYVSFSFSFARQKGYRISHLLSFGQTIQDLTQLFIKHHVGEMLDRLITMMGHPTSSRSILGDLTKIKHTAWGRRATPLPEMSGEMSMNGSFNHVIKHCWLRACVVYYVERARSKVGSFDRNFT